MANVLSCNLVSYRGHLQTAYRHLPEIGVRYVEIGAPAPDDAEGVLAELANHGLAPATIMASGDIASDGIAEQFAAFCDVAVRMNVKVMFTSVHAGDVPVQTVYDRMRRVGDQAARRGVLVAMETHPDLMQNGDVALRTLQSIGHPHVRMNFDTGNIMYYNEGTTTTAELAKVAPYVASVHLKDSNGRARAWDFPTLGEGIVDFPEVFRLLNEVGFYGPFTMELEGIEGQQFNEEEAAEDVARSAAYLRSIAELE